MPSEGYQCAQEGHEGWGRKVRRTFEVAEKVKVHHHLLTYPFSLTIKSIWKHNMCPNVLYCM
jgi:hypothetical protein